VKRNGGGLLPLAGEDEQLVIITVMIILWHKLRLKKKVGVRVMVFNTTLNSISVILSHSLLVEET
jgi:hypothetical protein